MNPSCRGYLLHSGSNFSSLRHPLVSPFSPYSSIPPFSLFSPSFFSTVPSFLSTLHVHPPVPSSSPPSPFPRLPSFSRLFSCCFPNLNLNRTLCSRPSLFSIILLSILISS